MFRVLSGLGFIKVKLYYTIVYDNVSSYIRIISYYTILYYILVYYNIFCHVILYYMISYI